MTDYTDFDNVLRDGRRIRLHPNGFIQVDLPASPFGLRQRLHVWHPNIRTGHQQESTGVHDHVYGFHSRIIHGSMTHISYRIDYDPEGQFVIYEQKKTDREDTVLVCQEYPVELFLTEDETRNFHEGEDYFVHKYDFHQVIVAGFCATLITITDESNEGGARVVFHKNRKPLKGFSRYTHDPKKLWEAVEETIG